VINPATEAVIGVAPTGGMSEAEQAVAAARRAFDAGPWPRLTPVERAGFMQRFYDGLLARKEQIISLIVQEAGGALRISGRQFDFPMQLAKYAIEFGARYRDMPLPPGTVNADRVRLVGGVIRREPVGVVSAITPYNYPYFLNVGKVFPALMMGNTVILKPSPYTPFCALVLAEVAAEVGLPPGVLSVITGGRDLGERLTSDPRIDLISFTGSDEVGAAIMRQASSTLKRLHFELGGKSALIVRHDADLDRAVAAGMAYLNHAGQGCALTTRHLVHNSVRKEYVERLAAAHRAFKVGDPADPTVDMGPLIREVQRRRVEDYVELGRNAGFRLVTGGRRPPHLTRGFFYEPTLFDDVDNSSSLAQDEIFGPVGAVIGFDDDAQAVTIANDSRYGLSGAIWSRDLGAAFEMARAMRTGGISINGGGSAPDSPFMTPFGGMKRSGFGREWGEEGLNAFTDLKAITFQEG